MDWVHCATPSRPLKVLTLFLIFLGLGFGTPNLALAQSLPPVVYSTTTAEDILRAYAIKYAINGDEFVATAKCESKFRANAKGDYEDGVPTSFGVFQIHLSAHKEITKAQAMDPLFAIDWSAKEFAAGRAYEWTCWRNLTAGSVD